MCLGVDRVSFGRGGVKTGARMQVTNGFLVLLKRQPGGNEGRELLIAPQAISVIEPHRTGCYVYAMDHKWDVAHSHAEIAQAVSVAIRGNGPLRGR